MIKRIFIKKGLIIQALIISGLFFISFFINKIPNNAFVAGGDFYQLINPGQHFDRYFYLWVNQIGQGVFNLPAVSHPFYSILALLDYLKFDSSVIAGFYIFFILYLSYLSFYFSIKFLYPTLTQNIKIGGALIYALNNFTLTIFTYPWGFTHHFLFYIFLPVLVLLFLKILTGKEILYKHIIFFSIIFLISTVSYNNIALLILIFFVQFLITIILLLLKKIKIGKNFFIKLFFITAIYILLSFWFTLPFYFEFIKAKLYSSGIMGDDYLVNWLLATSNTTLNIFFLALDKYRFPLIATGFSKFLSFTYFFIILFLLFRLDIKNQHKKNVYLFSLLLIIFIFFSLRASAPFKEIGLFIYQLPFFIVFRSPEKLFAIIPFLYAVLLVGLLHISSLKNRIIYFIFGILLIIPYPFYTGGVYKALNSHDSTSQYKYIIKIPQEYYNIQSIINTDRRLGSIISLPYAVVNSVNWSNYPKWHFIGHDVLHLLYNKFYISANSYDHPSVETKLSFKEFNEAKGNVEELLSLIQKYSGRFIIYHKDVEERWLKDSKYIQSSLNKLKLESKITLVESNDYFDLYEARDNLTFPLIVSTAPLSFQRVNPTKYKIKININKEVKIEFHQSYSPQWKLYLQPYSYNSWCKEIYYYDNLNITECEHTNKFFEGEELNYFLKESIFNDTHKVFSDYANAWTINPKYVKQNFSKEYYKENSDGSIDVEFTLYFKSQSYFYLGVLISGITFAVCIVILGFHFLREYKRKLNKFD